MLEFQSDIDKDGGEMCFHCFFKCHEIFHAGIMSHGVIFIGNLYLYIFKLLLSFYCLGQKQRKPKRPGPKAPGRYVKLVSCSSILSILEFYN